MTPSWLWLLRIFHAFVAGMLVLLGILFILAHSYITGLVILVGAGAYLYSVRKVGLA